MHSFSLASAVLAANYSTNPNPILLGIAGIIGGFAVGLTGMGGGAIMTPALVLLFRIDPRVAVASDLVNSLVMKPIGGGVHMKHGTIQWKLVRWLVVGSVPSAFFGAWLLNSLGDSDQVKANIKHLLGYALLVASVSIVAKAVLTGRSKIKLDAAGEVPNETPHTFKPIPTLLIGVVGGVIVGMTSVGSGSLMIVLLMLLYPRLNAKALVGTDLMQAIPLVASATLGQLVFGHVNFGLAGALIVGSVPGVYIGARFSAKAKDGIVRPVLVFILLASALGLLLENDRKTLGLLLLALPLLALPLWGAVDATLRPGASWAKTNHKRTTWVAVQSIGAPFGIGFVASILYFARVRGSVIRATHPSTGPGSDSPSDAIEASEPVLSY